MLQVLQMRNLVFVFVRMYVRMCACACTPHSGAYGLPYGAGTNARIHPNLSGVTRGSRITPAPYEKAQASEEICKRAAHPGSKLNQKNCRGGRACACVCLHATYVCGLPKEMDIELFQPMYVGAALLCSIISYTITRMIHVCPYTTLTHMHALDSMHALYYLILPAHAC